MFIVFIWCSCRLAYMQPSSLGDNIDAEFIVCHAASEVKAILNDAATSLTSNSDDFWVMAAALKRFVDAEGHGDLPLEVCDGNNLCFPLCFLPANPKESENRHLL